MQEVSQRPLYYLEETRKMEYRQQDPDSLEI